MFTGQYLYFKFSESQTFLVEKTESILYHGLSFRSRPAKCLHKKREVSLTPFGVKWSLCEKLEQVMQMAIGRMGAR